MKAIQGVADSLTSLGLCLGFIWYLIKKLDRAENWLYKQAGDKVEDIE